MLPNEYVLLTSECVFFSDYVLLSAGCVRRASKYGLLTTKHVLPILQYRLLASA